jgi:1-acyl-sn-glycerol-3-phosphate acyltransferase
VADAEIIPIGTRGRPGRGTGRAKPSSAARSLAGGAPPRPAAAKVAARRVAPAGSDPSARGPRTATTRRTASSAPPEPELIEQVTTEAVPKPPGRTRRPATTTTDRAPLAGVTPADWWSALQHAAREAFGEQWEPQLAQMLALLRRRLTGGYEVDEFGFDPEVTEKFMIALLRPVAEKWFRIEVRGIENIPAEGGALIVSNHSGTVPVDALMTMVTVHDHTGRFLRALGADLVFRMPFVGELARRGGATLACQEDAERMLRHGELVGVWPEGFKGIGKPFSQRYKLQRFGRGGFVSAALRTGVPIVPLSVVGAEEIFPLVGTIPSLARLLGVPYVPITPLFPWLGPLGMVPLPSKWLLEFGEPIRTDELDDGTQTAADDPMLVFNVTDQVRETIQQTLYDLLVKRESVFF